MSLSLVAQKTVFLVVMACTGDVHDQKCDQSFEPESWVNTTYVAAKEECEKFLRDEFDPKNYLEQAGFDYVAVRCE